MPKSEPSHMKPIQCEYAFWIYSIIVKFLNLYLHNVLILALPEKQGGITLKFKYAENGKCDENSIEMNDITIILVKLH